MDHAHRGAEAIKEGKFDEAIAHYTNALKQSPEAPQYFIGRSTAHHRKGKTGGAPSYEDAVADAERAVVYATKRAKRELVAEAQLRRALALTKLNRHGDAYFVISIAKERAKTDKPKQETGENKDKKKTDLEKLTETWEQMIRVALDKAKSGKVEDNAEDDEATKEAKRKLMVEVTVKELPDIDTTAQPSSTQASSTTKSEPAPAAAPSQTPASQIRHEWYQSSSTVTISVLAKGIPEDKYTVDIQDRSLEISFPLTTGSDYQLQFDPLFAAVDVSKSNYKLSKTRIEITLKKSVEGQKWAALEGTADDTNAATTTSTATNTAARTAALSNTAAGPYYPTSSKSGPKDWDKIAKSYAKPPKSAQKSSKSKANTETGAGTPPSSDADSDADEPGASASKKESKLTASKSVSKQKKENKDEIYVDSDSDAGDEVNGFFKQLYKGADPDTRRAMMKSYQESGGTALSTNWDEVSKGPVAVSPPDGMEEKKY